MCEAVCVASAPKQSSDSSHRRDTHPFWADAPELRRDNWCVIGGPSGAAQPMISCDKLHDCFLMFRFRLQMSGCSVDVVNTSIMSPRACFYFCMLLFSILFKPVFGKSHAFRKYCSHLLHRFLCLPRPNRRLGCTNPHKCSTSRVHLK